MKERVVIKEEVAKVEVFEEKIHTEEDKKEMEWISFDDVSCNSWVSVKYEGRQYIGLLLRKSSTSHCVQVQCLELPYPDHRPQKHEDKCLAVWYEEHDLYVSPVNPVLVKNTFNPRGWRYQY